MAMGTGRVDETLFMWTADEDLQMFELTPSQELTQKLFKNHTSAIKVTKHNLFSAQGVPEFLDSEWVKVLQGKAVNLDVILSGIHLTMSDGYVLLKSWWYWCILCSVCTWNPTQSLSNLALPLAQPHMPLL